MYCCALPPTLAATPEHLDAPAVCLQGVLSRLQAQLEVGDAALQPLHRHRHHQRRDQDQAQQQQLQAQQPGQQTSELGQVNTINAQAASPLCEAAERLTSRDVCNIAEGASRLCRYDAALWQALVHCASVQGFDSWPLQVSTA